MSTGAQGSRGAGWVGGGWGASRKEGVGTWVPQGAWLAVWRGVDILGEALKECHGDLEVWRAHPTSRVVHEARADLTRRHWCQPAKRWRLTQPSWASLLSSPHLFLHFCSQQQANLIPGLNLSALGIFSTGLSVLPPPAGPRGAPPAPPYHPFAVSSSASRGLLMLWAHPGSSITLLCWITAKALIWRP